MVNKIILKIRSFYLALWDCFCHQNVKPSKHEIDVVIPIIKKDLGILPLCLQGVKNSVTNKIKAIYIVSPDDIEIKTFCKDNGYIYVNENKVLGISVRDVNYFTTCNGKTENRSGWLFQQLIKLSGNVGTCENYLCIDADHILIKDHTFLDYKERPVFYMSEEFHLPYRKAIKKLTSITSIHPMSFVAHKMLFNKKILKNLQRDVEGKFGVSWYQAIINNIERDNGATFSEFETYGNFVKERILIPWGQHALRYSSIKEYEKLRQEYRSKYKSLTFPAWFNK